MSIPRLLPLCIWALLINIVGLFTWGYGPLTFFSLLLIVRLLFSLRALSLSPLALSPECRTHAASPCWILVPLLVGALIYVTAGIIHGFTVRPDRLLDIAENTYVADDAFAKGLNPYATKAQVLHRIVPGPHVEVSGDKVKFFGVPYSYGYPYFPIMFLSYLPGYYLVSGFNSIRAVNVLLLVMNIFGVALLTSRLAESQNLLHASLVAVLAYLCVIVYPHEIFSFGVVDILISTYALYAFLALSYQRYWTAGVLFGLAQACKLLPGPLLLIPALLVFWGKSDGWKLLIGYLFVSALSILPFLLWDPGAFLSATVLYYLTYHAGGDDTSLWFFLPESIKGVFLVAGVLLSITTMALFARTKGGTLLDAVTAAFGCYVVFMAFSKMTHLNYLWGVYPLGCISLAALGEREGGGAKGRRGERNWE